jgi:hypothetical protein
MTMHTGHPLDHPDVRNASLGTFVLGYAASLGFMGVALLITLRHDLS